jgi:signal transduction histidine kinase
MPLPAAAGKSIRSIQLRLFALLLRAFGIVVLLTVVFLLALAGVMIATQAGHIPFYQSPLSTVLETYYLAHGSWEGVEALSTSITLSSFSDEIPPRWENVLLVDENGVIVADHGQVDRPLVGTTYVESEQDVIYPLHVQDIQVGTLVWERGGFPAPWYLAISLLRPVLFLSLLPALLTLIIGMFLMRRVVSPLAEVVAAAQSVAGGDFSTRVEVCGPDDLRALSDSFNHMTEALERYDRERRNMLADIAHELRTPLTVIRGRLEGILDGIYAANGEAIAPVLQETYLLDRLVEDLRLLTLAESHQLQFEHRALDLGELAQRAVSLFGAEAEERGISLALDVQPDLPLVSADAQRVEQVVGNLLGNALRFTPDQGQIEIRVQSASQEVMFQVSDSGPGVPEADLPYIFDRFWRGEKSRSRAGGGAGLGLAIARQLVEIQGGKIWAEKAPEGGLRVTFTFPTAQ